MDCGQLQILDIPPSVEVIEAMALNGGVRTLIVRSIEPPRVNTNKDFFNLSASVIYVPDESMEQYQAASGWSKHTERLRPLSKYPG